MQSNSKPFIVVDGVTYINEAMISDSALSVKLRSRATDEAGRPVVELDLSSGSITLRSRVEGDDQCHQGMAGQVIFGSERWAIRRSRDESGRYFAAGVGLGVDQVLQELNIIIADSRLAGPLKEKIELMEAVKEAVVNGARAGYQAVLKEFGKRSS
ncbi:MULTISPECIES: hypothetical protein [unclassified Pseudomonas]|uniref:hypothetical protein n=1 Tax=unclassified Pseudomonas TaxID=196821 RepID=UPI0004853255|nr:MULTISPECIES: hypothetical protein [unclassified Pseudomonas]RAS34012.1 hypothetical protein H040_00135 [Pseudomonas sp. URMO17WK12:I7]SME90343.1 hypothetical protein SAMN02745903_00135 [Pseudomonas sp. URMO17WK12:I5]